MEDWDDIKNAPKGWWRTETQETAKGPRERRFYHYQFIVAYRDGHQRPIVTRWIPEEVKHGRTVGGYWEGYTKDHPPTLFVPLPELP